MLVVLSALLYVLDHVLQLLQGPDFYDVAGGLRLEHRLLTGEWIHPFASRRGRLALNDDLAQAWQSECLRTLFAERASNLVTESIEDRAHVFFGQAGTLGDVGVNFSLRGRLFCCGFRHCRKPSLVLTSGQDYLEI